jgi:hypothetical protein
MSRVIGPASESTVWDALIGDGEPGNMVLHEPSGQVYAYQVSDGDGSTPGSQLFDPLRATKAPTTTIVNVAAMAPSISSFEGRFWTAGIQNGRWSKPQ